MSKRFTLGIEEEFQLVDPQSGKLRSSAQSILEKGAPIFEEQIKPEMLQSTVEFISTVLPDIAAARLELYAARALLARLLQNEGLVLISAGTHPISPWWEQKRTPRERYESMEDEYQDLGRSIQIFGLHVHVAVDSKERSVKLMNQVRTWLPQLVALSSNSPFWNGRMTGIKSYRSVVWKSFPRSGMPDIYRTREDFDRYVQRLVDAGCIDNAKKIWWDIRPHPFFDTLEFRISDMPASVEDTLALAALCQALVARLTQLDEQGQDVPILERDYIDENKWRATRYGLDAEWIDFAQNRRLSMRDAIRETLEFVDGVVDELGSRREMNYLRALLDDPRGTGADRQMAIYQQSGGDLQQVVRYLIEQTMQGVQQDDASFSEKFLRFKAIELAV
ncbi:carboxylate-amine ligase [Tengunoibacter tsumagoiensis]|uniref:Putative glutamate--cysteine ligase 2 n=1 Tax=Tengunoibacter tsumagoiensis TaxID=2014871 RepID=A0A402A2L0_9CHLR|nr:carboxylate-amine ligase [Tengunoibacter tsumagoiensis]GCE13383.1 putative glutamate--cysteine ligase 2 [Tengunoibacter tsumagoiensis]